MKYTSISVVVMLVSSIICFAQSPEKSAPFDEAYFEKHDEQMVESLREKMKEEFLRGASLKSMTQSLKRRKIRPSSNT